MDKITNLLNSIPAKMMGLLKKKPQVPEPVLQPQAQPVQNLMPQMPPQMHEPEPKISFLGRINRKEIVILVVMLLAIIILALLAVVFKIQLPIPGFIQPTPTPVATATPIPTPVPKYFNDPDMLKLEENTNVLENELNNIDIEESNIQPRPLDWDINFKK